MIRIEVDGTGSYLDSQPNTLCIVWYQCVLWVSTSTVAFWTLTARPFLDIRLIFLSIQTLHMIAACNQSGEVFSEPAFKVFRAIKPALEVASKPEKLSTNTLKSQFFFHKPHETKNVTDQPVESWSHSALCCHYTIFIIERCNPINNCRIVANIDGFWGKSST